MSKSKKTTSCDKKCATPIVATMTTRDIYDNFIFTSEHPETVETMKNVQSVIHEKYPTCYSPVWIANDRERVRDPDGKEKAKITVAGRMIDGRSFKANRGLDYKLTYNVVCATSLKGKKYIKIVLNRKPQLADDSAVVAEQLEQVIL